MYIIVDVNKRFKFNQHSLLYVVDDLIKFFFALDCKYSYESETLWLFLQKGLYDIHLDKTDKPTTQINQLIGFINNRLNNQN